MFSTVSRGHWIMHCSETMEQDNCMSCSKAHGVGLEPNGYKCKSEPLVCDQ